MVGAALIAVLATTSAAEPLKLASTGLQGYHVEPEALDFYSQHLAQRFTLLGCRVTTQKEIGAVLGLERQKALLGCSSESSTYMTEIASALGVDALITGEVAKVETRYQLNLKLLSAKDARAMAAYSATVEGEAALLDALTAAAEAMGRQVGISGAAANAHPRRGYAWIPGLLGAVFGAGAAFSFIGANSIHAQLTTSGGPAFVGDPTEAARTGTVVQITGWGLLALATAALALAVVFFFTGPEP